MLTFVSLAASCGPMPRDPDGTVERIAAGRKFAVGHVAGAGGRASHALVAALAQELAARPILRIGQLEPLLLALERGELDLVTGASLDPKTPWATRVTLSPPLGEGGKDGAREFAVMRNGENAWIIRVNRAAKRIGIAR